MYYPDKKEFIKELQPLNIQARYPAYKEMIYKKLKKAKAQEILKNTKEKPRYMI